MPIYIKKQDPLFCCPIFPKTTRTFEDLAQLHVTSHTYCVTISTDRHTTLTSGA